MLGMASSELCLTKLETAPGEWALFLQGRETVVGMEKVGTPCGRTENAVPAQDQTLLAIKRGVLGDCFLLVFRNFFGREDRIRRAGCDAGAAVHAILRIDIHLRFSFPLRFVRLGMNRIAASRINAELVFCAGISDYMGHDCFSPGFLNASITASRHIHSKTTCCMGR